MMPTPVTERVLCHPWRKISRKLVMFPRAGHLPHEPSTGEKGFCYLIDQRAMILLHMSLPVSGPVLYQGHTPPDGCPRFTVRCGGIMYWKTAHILQRSIRFARVPSYIIQVSLTACHTDGQPLVSKGVHVCHQRVVLTIPVPHNMRRSPQSLGPSFQTKATHNPFRITRSR
jgi:hypothetical protein